VGCPFQIITIAELMDVGDRAGIPAIRGLQSLQPARELILGFQPTS
jgi:hypothetical protein